MAQKYFSLKVPAPAHRAEEPNWPNGGQSTSDMGMGQN